MAQQLMWSVMETRYRGQASNGSIITVTQDAHDIAHKQAGRQVFETDWWVETLPQVLQNWGIYIRQVLDRTTLNHCVDFSHAPFDDAAPDPAQQPGARSNPLGSGPLTGGPASGPLNKNTVSGSLSDRLSGSLNNRLASGSLSERLSGKLNPKDAEHK